MRHFGHIAPEQRQRLFYREPTAFDADSPARVLAAALGATLYSPATRERLADDIVKQAGRGVVSMVLCLEDSIDDAEVVGAEENLVRQFADLAGRPDVELPLLFIRVRFPEQIPDLVDRFGPAVRLLSGFVFPKFTEERGVAFLEALTAAEAASGRRLFGMPVLESPELMYRETRVEALQGIAHTVDKYRDRVLALRLGVTDFCSSYALRRPPDMTAYDVQIVASVIADVVNVLGRADGTGFTVTGPVWEYFRVQERMFKPQLRTSPFLANRAGELRESLIEHALDGLLREISLDQANGLLGKTCIHPSHVLPVHALSVVSHEEFGDAQDIVRPERNGGGVLRSASRNKMNEVKPHRAWAERVLQRAEVFGVANEDIGFVDLLAAGLPD
ncbi:HpcH/HpaI aldolase/citrate lyase family protein [Streptomyces caniscabiei]|uniref:HpcH/HpaI aldolase/citrate lyase family protein n=1 Tax=Streptomyces caniscabiei TaxID=2746961 RepID=A0A927L183_9ACTN|nr:HpcH/HpaI aldolase/citrate lyase family protein [Streptomyces caniscabiei]MBD9704230.1 HpcH/HpaI aldolase/citrate lyase family protein [Streptomyces caniscabiei]MBD9723775.1 HpcH/HpaI aldolase/citrate lyase family protein [Streptomyces caniscabiei]MDX3511266.1 HpcH/HpaI aldolase/citrate lyase family protein [Streptomyces caniscabiei]MDX3721346.1 HpcH/HpaI aldolase/citrate lyase family protein [Streptomyces caniscabiei]MDX3725379.1 HpcH/HpaI aldolase/citrate lyase family protein [Streptomyce